MMIIIIDITIIKRLFIIFIFIINIINIIYKLFRFIIIITWLRY